MAKVTKMSIARDLFYGAMEESDPTTMDNKELATWRAHIISQIVRKTGTNEKSAATMYQIVKRNAIRAGDVKDFGRTAQGNAGGRKPKVRIPENAKWARVDSKGKTVAYYPTRTAARADKLEGTKVVKL